jgi:hypothetical protein
MLLLLLIPPKRLSTAARCVFSAARKDRIHALLALPPSVLQICVFGAGVIRGYFAAELALAGNEADVIARGAQQIATPRSGKLTPPGRRNAVVHAT